MDKELEDYYEARFEMFASKGWKDLMEDMQKMYESADSIEGIKTKFCLAERHGEINMMKWLLNLENISRETYEDLKNEDTA